MAEEVVIKYRIDTSEFGKVGVAVTDVSKKVDDLKAKAQTAFASGQIDAATNKLIQQGDTMGALIERYGSATKALKAMEKELATMAAVGQRNTKEFKELAKATAELKDTVGDTRGEIRKMASDTRVFDTMVQGARGVAAAFSVATGLAAALGDENKDLQKTLLKVQGAMAALQGVQELANIATEKGGIATKAYGAALQVVDKISKVTGLSMAASWALATAGLTAVLGLIAYFISSTEDANEASEELNKTLSEQKDELTKLEIEYQNASGSIDDYTKSLMLLEIERRKQIQAISSDADQKALEKSAGLLNSIIAVFSPAAAASLQARNYAKNYKKEMDKRGAEVDNINAIFDKKRAIERAKNDEKLAKELEAQRVKNFEKAKKEETSKVVDTIKVELKPEPLKGTDITISGPVPTVQLKPSLTKLDLGEQITKITGEVANSLQAIKPYADNINAIMNAAMQTQTNVMQAEYERRLALAGDNSKKREKIEREFAVKSAKLARQQAVANKVFATFNILLSTSQSIAKAAEKGFPAAIPFVAMAAALGAAQIAAVASQPLPEIPTFEKGGRVLAGGRKDDGMLYGRSHRQGGILIEAQGGEYIWDIPTVKKHGDVIKAAHENRLEQHVFHKYVVPQMQKGRAVQAQNESYDDFMLRTTVKNSAMNSADHIVKGIVKGLKNDGYLISRYG